MKKKLSAAAAKKRHENALWLLKQKDIWVIWLRESDQWGAIHPDKNYKPGKNTTLLKGAAAKKFIEARAAEFRKVK